MFQFGPFKVIFSRLAVLAIVFAVVPQVWAQNESLTPVDRIVAIVEEDVILESELEQATSTILRQIATQGVQAPPRSVLREQILERLVMIELQMQRATQSGIRITDSEIDNAMRQLAQQNNMSLAQLRNAVVADGLSFLDFRDQMRRELTTQQLHQQVINDQVDVTETEVDIYLSSGEHTEGEYRLSHILLSLPEGADASDIALARAEAEEVRQKLDEGVDFAQAAITYSDGQQALEGGDLGWRPANQLPTVFAELVRTMEVGEVSRPIRSASGFHIVKVVGQRDGQQRMVHEINARHIMIRVTELVSSEVALEEILEVQRRIESGESFESLAEEFSDDNLTAGLGGDLGWFPPNAYGTRMQEVLDALKPDEVSQPFQTNAGWHIVQLLGHREQDRTEQLVRGEAREAIRQRKAQEALELWLRQIRGEAFVELRLDA